MNYAKILHQHIISRQDKPLIIAIIGHPGSGKTTAVKNIEAMAAIPQFKSYTTRPKRIRFEDEYYFVSHERAQEMLLNENILAKTVYGGETYFGLVEDVRPVQTYIIDPLGLEYLMQKHGDKYRVYAVWLEGDNNVSSDRKNRAFAPANIHYNMYIKYSGLDDLIIQLYRLILNFC
jgi:DNA helicase HerA-like ATPase